MFSRLSSSSVNPFAAVWAGDYERALGELYNDTRPGATVMRARLYGHMRHERRVLAEYAAGANERLDVVESVIYRAIVASAMHATGDHETASRLLAAAERDAKSQRDPLLALTVAYYRAIGEYASGAQGGAEAISEATLARLDELDERHLLPREPYRFEGNHLRARLLQNRSIAHYVRGDYAVEERALVDALLCVELVRTRDVVLEANLLSALASMLFRFPSIRARELVYVKARALTFTAHTDHRRAAIKSALSANRLIFGNALSPETLGGRSAPMLAYRLSGCVGSLLYDTWPNVAAYRDEIAFAASLARASDWDVPSEDEANRLLTFAALVAAHDRALAEELVSCFERALRTYSRFLVSFRDPRRLMLEAFARASIAKAAGDTERARAEFEPANAFWRERGLMVPAALGGIEAYPLTGDERDLSPARAFVGTYPHSAFAQRLRAALAACAHSPVPMFPYFSDSYVSPAKAG